MKIRTILKILGSALLLIILVNCLRISWLFFQCYRGWGLDDHQLYTNYPPTTPEVNNDWVGDLPDVTVGKLRINILPDEETIFFGVFHMLELRCDNRLWEILRLVDNKEEFEKLTMDNWRAKHSQLSARIIQKSADQHLNASSLSQCINHLYLHPSEDKLIELPTAAFNVFYDKKEAWVICYVWEYEDTPSLDETPMTIGHIRAYLFDAKTCEYIGMVTCG
jgi:hypothetical protein